MRQFSLPFLFLNLGHFLDHFYVLIFATAVLPLTTEWGLSYAALIPYATPGFIAFGVGAIPAGWLADRWSREGMMTLFFIGIGLSSMLAGTAEGPLEMALYLTLVGLFGAIYHPVGLAMVVEQFHKTGLPIAINGIFGNMGVASAALLTGFLIDQLGWRSAFILPGFFSVVVGILYLLLIWKRPITEHTNTSQIDNPPVEPAQLAKPLLIRLFTIILFTAAIGGFIFQSTTFTLPKVLDEQLIAISGEMTTIGWYSFLVFTIASLAQLVIGHLLDRYSLRKVFSIVALLQALLFFTMTQSGGSATVPLAIAFMLAVFGQVPINDVLIGRIARSHWRSRAYALRSIVTFSVMATALPLVAWIHGAWGFDLLFVLLSLAALLVFIAVQRLPASHALAPNP